ncbi:MAG: OmpH family outer membrane protein [Rhodospirillaceae bacterium]|nr:OmpH family outer membrane protein [Rhodospirillaceae bacterium]MYH36389.1 OmpH family outer membrane protein [Rhodospirillaceae bacterium]MYK15066.1 OmpH family outer membrane protein [Rhodospirillaceae bacterium]
MKVCGLLSLAAAIALGTVSASQAQTKAPAIRIGIVDVQQVQRDSRAMIGIRKALEALRTKYNKNFESTEKEMQAEYDRLRKDKEMSRGEYERRVRALQAELVKLRRQSRARNDALGQAFQQAFAKFRQEVVLVVKAMAVEDGLTLILNQVALIHATPQFNITEKVVARLNKRLPKLALNFKDPVGNARKEVKKRREKAKKKQ